MVELEMKNKMRNEMWGGKLHSFSEHENLICMLVYNVYYTYTYNIYIYVEVLFAIGRAIVRSNGSTSSWQTNKSKENFTFYLVSI